MPDLGEFHKKVHTHINQLIANPDLIMRPNVSYKDGSLNGEEWESAEVMKMLSEEIPKYSHFQELLVAFLTGAAETWACFISEFAPGGLIDEATLEEKERAWMPATNDVNEGALGAFCNSMQRQPQLALLGHNALKMYFTNSKQAFMAAKFTQPDDYQFLHQMA